MKTKIRLLSSRVSDTESLAVGAEIEVEAAEARRMVEAGLGVIIATRPETPERSLKSQRETRALR